tara:strand:- start:4433 stop:4567 length:135 start_codon:yes stop_codon:yes gene_type:complete
MKEGMLSKKDSFSKTPIRGRIEAIPTASSMDAKNINRKSHANLA